MSNPNNSIIWTCYMIYVSTDYQMWWSEIWLRYLTYLKRVKKFTNCLHHTITLSCVSIPGRWNCHWQQIFEKLFKAYICEKMSSKYQVCEKILLKKTTCSHFFLENLATNDLKFVETLPNTPSIHTHIYTTEILPFLALSFYSFCYISVD